jgi:hypothetical protein
MPGYTLSRLHDESESASDVDEACAVQRSLPSRPRPRTTTIATPGLNRFAQYVGSEQLIGRVPLPTILPKHHHAHHHAHPPSPSKPT